MADLDALNAATAAMSAGLIAVANELRARSRARQADQDRAAARTAAAERLVSHTEDLARELANLHATLSELRPVVDGAAEMLEHWRTAVSLTPTTTHPPPAPADPSA